MTDATVIAGSPPSPVRARVNAGTGFWASSVAVARRTVRKFVRTPQLLALATVQSALFLVIFRYIFGGAITVDGLAGGPQAQALLDHSTAYYIRGSLIWSAAIVVVFGVLAAVRFSRS